MVPWQGKSEDALEMTGIKEKTDGPVRTAAFEKNSRHIFVKNDALKEHAEMPALNQKKKGRQFLHYLFLNGRIHAKKQMVQKTNSTLQAPLKRCDRVVLIWRAFEDLRSHLSKEYLM